MNKLTFFLFLLLISACTSTRSDSVVLQPENRGGVQVLLTSFPAQRYREVALVEIEGPADQSKSYYIRKLKKRARKYKPDALIEIHFEYGPANIVYASAVAIKYR